MKSLKDILFGVSLIEIHGDRDQQVSAITFDSRSVDKDSLFIAIVGLTTDGHQFIGQSIKAGATAIICEELPEDLKEGITYVVVENSAASLGIVADNFYDHPSRKLSLVGITGTNGKTTMATLLYELFKELGYKVGLLSTVENGSSKPVSACSP